MFLNFRLQFQGLTFSYFVGSDASPREPDAGLSSGAPRALELKTASRTPARFARRLRRKIFLIFVTIFLSFGSRCWVMFLQFRLISGAKCSYLVFSYRVSGVYARLSDRLG